jgi:hypothetical protein
MTYEEAKKLKNGQYIQVNVCGEWVDALFVLYTTFFQNDIGIYAVHMGFDTTLWEPTGIYGTKNYFALDEVRLPKGIIKCKK